MVACSISKPTNLLLVFYMCINNTSRLIYPMKRSNDKSLFVGTQSLLWEDLKLQTLIVQKPSK